MSDLLDRVAIPGLDLLGRVDAALAAAGAPAGDPVWPLLREVGALPGDLLAHLLDAVPEPVETATEAVRRAARDIDRAADAVPGVAGWTGHAADGYAARWSATMSRLDRITARLDSNADYATEVAEWIRGTRRRVAGAVAECLASRDAATVRLATGTADAETGRAAAAIAAHILGAAADAIAEAYALRQRWAGRLDELHDQPVDLGTGIGAPSVIEL